MQSFSDLIIYFRFISTNRTLEWSTQIDDVKLERPIAYASNTLNMSKKYITIERECLSIIYTVKHYVPPTFERNFSIQTDHASPFWMLRGPNFDGMLAKIPPFAGI